jgi:hypothetical protein
MSVPLCGAACMPTAKPSFDSAEPAARNAAIVQAARTGDRATIPNLVRMLASDDPATRVLAIRTLEQLTGTTNGFDATASDQVRAAGIQAWEGWLRGQNGAPQGDPQEREGTASTAAHAHSAGGQR